MLVQINFFIQASTPPPSLFYFLFSQTKLHVQVISLATIYCVCASGEQKSSYCPMATSLQDPVPPLPPPSPPLIQSCPLFLCSIFGSPDCFISFLGKRLSLLTQKTHLRLQNNGLVQLLVSCVSFLKLDHVMNAEIGLN